MSNESQLKLEDFIPSYAHFDTNEYGDNLFDIYHDEPENVFYRKKELNINKLERIETRPLLPGIPLKSQQNISIFLSPNTLNDEQLLFNDPGSGKCLHPSTNVLVNNKYQTIESLWKNNVVLPQTKFDGKGLWGVPKNKLIVKSMNNEGNIQDCVVDQIYRQLVHEELFEITLENDKKIICTGEHKFYTNKWVRAKHLTLKDSLSTIEDSQLLFGKSIKSIKQKLFDGYVFDLEVKDFHNYIAEGIITHNTCSAVTISELATTANPQLNPTLVLVKGGPLRRNFIRELTTKCTKGQYIPDNYEILTQGEKVTRTNKLVNKKYEIHTFETFAKEISKYSDAYIKRRYSNRVIIIDEVHHIRRKGKKKGSVNGSVLKTSVYKILHKFLHLVENTKRVLMTGTPMVDRPEEFADVMNLILPLDNQLPVGKEFINEYFEDGKLKKKKLKKKIRGKVSYLRAIETGLTKVFKGELYRDMKKLKIVPSKMDDFQSKSYTDAYNIDTKGTKMDLREIEEEDEDPNENEEKQGLYDKSRQASLFVFPNGTYGSDGFSSKDKKDKKEKKEEEYVISLGGGNYSLLPSFKKELTNDGKATVNQIIDNIRKYSSIYADTIDEIIKHPDENTFVFIKYVYGSGAILFSDLLKLVGIERTRGRIDTTDTKRVSRHALITGKTVSEVEIDRIIDGVFNDPKNKKGHLIQVVIGSQLIGEGKSLKNVRQIHILTPHWNNSETEQAIARGIRAFSHSDLDEEDRYVKIFRRASVPLGGVESINYQMYKISEDKDFPIKEITRACKESDPLCELSKERNILPTDKDGSRECDYMECEYKCDKTTSNLKEESLITDTYNIFYAEEEISSIITVVKQLFRKKFSYDLMDLLQEFQDTSTIVLIRALKEIIDKSIQLTNRYGFPCFLREDHNTYFLVDEITLPNSFLLSRYAEHPNVKRYYDFEDIVKLLQYRYVDDRTFVLENLDPKDEDEKKQIFKQLDSMSPTIKEIFLETVIVANNLDKEKSKELREAVTEYFQKYIIGVKDKLVSSVLLDSEDRMRCVPKDSTDLKDWYECDDTIEQEIEDVKTEEKVNLELNPYGYYGIMTKKFTKYPFKIMKVEPPKKDKRKMWKGPVCMEINNKQVIIDIIEELNEKKLNIVPPIEISMKDKDLFVGEILQKTNKYDEDELREMSDKRLKNIYYWYVKALKRDMCDGLQKWFENKGLILYS